MRHCLKDLSANMSLKERVYILLKERIINGDLKSGTRLNELELSNVMNISRGPIREALNMLEKDGFVSIIPRKGAIVAKISVQDVKNIWEMRKLLEPYAAKLCLDKYTDEDIKCIENKLKSVLQNPRDFDLYIKVDLELHEFLHKYVDNKLLKDTLVMIKEHSLRLRYYSEGKINVKRDVMLTVSKEHLDIINAIKERDKQKVEKVVNAHLINSENRTLNALNGNK